VFTDIKQTQTEVKTFDTEVQTDLVPELVKSKLMSEQKTRDSVFVNMVRQTRSRRMSIAGKDPNNWEIKVESSDPFKEIQEDLNQGLVAIR